MIVAVSGPPGSDGNRYGTPARLDMGGRVRIFAAEREWRGTRELALSTTKRSNSEVIRHIAYGD
jgi:hypothetical protein